MTKYASGEEPQVGDRVRVIDAQLNDSVKTYLTKPVAVGDVLYIGRISKIALGDITLDVDLGPYLPPKRFTLIARAGQPVEYLPGDVVELTESSLGANAKRVGERDTVEALDGDGDPILSCDKSKACGWPAPNEHFRLVHRPDAPKVEEGLAQRSPQKPIAEIARALRPGQKVRVETRVEGEVSEYQGVPWPAPGVWLRDRGFTPLGRITSLEIIEDAPPKPLAVGDRVRVAGAEANSVIRYIEGSFAALWPEGGSYLITAPLDRLERAA